MRVFVFLILFVHFNVKTFEELVTTSVRQMFSHKKKVHSPLKFDGVQGFKYSPPPLSSKNNARTRSLYSNAASESTGCLFKTRSQTWGPEEAVIIEFCNFVDPRWASFNYSDLLFLLLKRKMVCPWFVPLSVAQCIWFMGCGSCRSSCWHVAWRRRTQRITPEEEEEEERNHL